MDKDARIADLEAENARLREVLYFISRLDHAAAAYAARKALNRLDQLEEKPHE